jgi:hypothetical protein
MVRFRHASLLVVTAALTAGLVTAGAGVAPSAAAARPAALAPHVVSSFTGGWQEEFDPTGRLVSDITFTKVGLVANLGPGTIVFEGQWDSGMKNINKFTGPFGVHLAAGTTYSTFEGASIDVPCVGSFNVNDFVLSGKNAISAAVQYSMTCPSGFSYVGAEAVNLLNQPGIGYYLFTDTGALYGLGNNAFLCYQGDLSASPLNAPVVAMATTPDGAGYLMAAADGGIFTFGDATFHGSAGDIALNSPIVGMAATQDGQGYWLVAADGGIFAFGDAGYFGSMGGKHLNAPIVGMAPTRYGHGYYMVAADGGIFTFGDAQFYGSAGAHPLNAGIVGMTAAPNGQGYWFVASDGGVFSYGNAKFYGSTGNLKLSSTIVSMAATPDGGGYWLLGGDGGVFAFGDALYAGGLAGTSAGLGFVGITHT